MSNLIFFPKNNFEKVKSFLENNEFVLLGTGDSNSIFQKGNSILLEISISTKKADIYPNTAPYSSLREGEIKVKSFKELRKIILNYIKFGE